MLRLTKAAFRANPDKVAQWAKVLNMKITQEVLQTLRDDGPEFEGRVIGASEEDLKVLFGHRSGFADHHRQLELMGEHESRPPARPAATYENEPIEEEENA